MPPPPMRHGAVAPRDDAARLDLADVAQRGARRRQVGQHQHRRQSVEVDLTWHGRIPKQRGQFRGELQPAAGRAPVERLHADAVADQMHLARAGVVDRQGEHPVEPVQAVETGLLEEVGHHLDVAAGAEPVATAGQLGPQFDVVEDLAVADDRHVAGRDRLPAARDVDDGEPRDPERDGRTPRHDRLPVVGAAVRHGAAHVVDEPHRAARTGRAGDPTHGYLLVGWPASLRNSAITSSAWWSKVYWARRSHRSVRRASVSRRVATTSSAS